ncbi:MAG TPA: enolase C-terminal domain-like protein, partial [Chloroflexota bacterium]|nr:enolase C-terminal domain-like protein [Chloroflexota bacterium]
MRQAKASAEPRVIVPTQPSPPRHGTIPGPTVTDIQVSVYKIPTATPEADGTIAWDATTMVMVELAASSGQRGLGFSYASRAAAEVIREMLAPVVAGRPVDAVRAIWGDLIRVVRNAGRPGIAATAISAVDVALWDLKARVAGQPLFRLLGAHRAAVPIYGSGGFTTYTDQQLADQLRGWVAEGIPRVKMKIGKDWGTEPQEDLRRVGIARQAIGPTAELYVDANGGYTVKEATELARRFADFGVTWFEEPVSSDQLSQLAFVRGHVSTRVAAGEYGYGP